MFENLTEKLQRTFKNLRGQGKLTDEHLDVARSLKSAKPCSKATSTSAWPMNSSPTSAQSDRQRIMLQLSPISKSSRLFATNSRHAGKACQADLRFAPAVGLDDCRLQGVPAKTTTTGKLAKWLSQHGHRPLVVSTDVYRPAAREQLAQVAKAVGTAVWPGTGTDKPARNRQRRHQGSPNFPPATSFSVDTAAIAYRRRLMNELSMLKKELQPAKCSSSQIP